MSAARRTLAAPGRASSARRPRRPDSTSEPSRSTGSSSCQAPSPAAAAMPSRAGALDPRVRGEQPPELAVVRRPKQVGELVEHVVEDVPRHTLEPLGDPDGSVRRRARAPAAHLVAHPAHRRGTSGVGEVDERSSGAADRLGVVRSSAAVRREPTQHRVDPVPLLGLGEPAPDEDDGPAALAVGADGAPASPAAPHLDRRRGRVRDAVRLRSRPVPGSRLGHEPRVC